MPAPAQEVALSGVTPKTLVTEARALFPQFAEVSPELVFYYLCRTARIEARSGDLEAAKKTLAEAEELLTTKLPKTSNFDFDKCEFARTQAALGDLDGAYQTAGLVEETGYRNDLYCDITMVCGARGDIAGTLQAAERIEEGVRHNSRYGRRRTIGQIIEERLESGDLTTGKALLEKELQDPQKIAIDLPKVVHGLIVAKDLPTAIRTTDTLPNYPGNFPAQCEIVMALAKNGATQTAKKRIASLPPKASDKKSDQIVLDLVSLGRAQWAIGDVKTARKTFAEATVQAGKVPENKQAYWNSRSHLYTVLAKAQAESGDVSGAKVSFAAAKENIGMIGDYTPSSSRIGEIGMAQLATGDIAGAKETAELGRSSTTNHGLENEIALVLLDRGDEAGALSLLARKKYAWLQDDYVFLINHLAKKSDFKRALRFTDKLDPQHLLIAKLTIAEAMVNQVKR